MPLKSVRGSRRGNWENIRGGGLFGAGFSGPLFLHERHHMQAAGRRRDPAVRAAGYEPVAITVVNRAKRSHVALGSS